MTQEDVDRILEVLVEAEALLHMTAIIPSMFYDPDKPMDRQPGFTWANEAHNAVDLATRRLGDLASLAQDMIGAGD